MGLPLKRNAVVELGPSPMCRLASNTAQPYLPSLMSTPTAGNLSPPSVFKEGRSCLTRTRFEDAAKAPTPPIETPAFIFPRYFSSGAWTLAGVQSPR